MRRFDIEHTFRFCKNTLGWTTPRLCTPDQADRWTWLITAAYTQLRLARPLVADQRLPWESSLTSDCPGRNPPNQTNSPPRVSGAGFDDLPQRWAHRPTHQNPARQAPAAPKEPAAAHEPATQRSRKPPNQV